MLKIQCSRFNNEIKLNIKLNSHVTMYHVMPIYGNAQVKQYIVADNREELLKLLQNCHALSLWLDLYNIDPLIPGELALKTALLVEANASRLESSVFTRCSVGQF